MEIDWALPKNNGLGQPSRGKDASGNARGITIDCVCAHRTEPSHICPCKEPLKIIRKPRLRCHPVGVAVRQLQLLHRPLREEGP
eukprot:3701278-Pyramimonas_sp.AAC.2